MLGQLLFCRVFRQCAFWRGHLALFRRSGKEILHGVFLQKALCAVYTVYTHLCVRERLCSTCILEIQGVLHHLWATLPSLTAHWGCWVIILATQGQVQGRKDTSEVLKHSQAIIVWFHNLIILNMAQGSGTNTQFVKMNNLYSFLLEQCKLERNLICSKCKPRCHYRLLLKEPI